MKKITFLIGFAFLSLVSVQAQEFNFGVKGGVNFASISGDGTDELDGRTGFHLGVVAELPLAQNFSFQPEVLYSAQGAATEGSDTYEGITDSWEYELKLDYINVPLLAKYYVAPGFNIHAGPQLSLLVNSEAEGSYSYDGDSGTISEELEDMKTIDFALAAGLGYQLEMGLFLNARYNLGLTNIDDSEGSSGDYSQKNSVFQLSVGYMF